MTQRFLRWRIKSCKGGTLAAAKSMPPCTKKNLKKNVFKP